MERSTVFQATREAVSAESALYQGRLETLNVRKEAEMEIVQKAKLIKSDGKSKTELEWGQKTRVR